MGTAEQEPLIAVAAEPLEFRGLLRRARRVRRLGWPLAFAREADIGGRRWILAAHGPGPRLARHAAQTSLDRCGGRAVVLSTGFCGGLDPMLRPGDVFIAGEIIEAATGARFPTLPLRDCPQARHGLLWSQDRVAATAEEKAQIRRRGPDAVDMEAAAVAAEAARRRVPFHCVRVVSDAADGSLPLDFNAFRDAEGRFSRSRITLFVLLHPSRVMPLLRFRRECRRAANRLGEFLVHCCF